MSESIETVNLGNQMDDIPKIIKEVSDDGDDWARKMFDEDTASHLPFIYPSTSTLFTWDTGMAALSRDSAVHSNTLLQRAASSAPHQHQQQLTNPDTLSSNYSGAGGDKQQQNSQIGMHMSDGGNMKIMKHPERGNRNSRTIEGRISRPHTKSKVCVSNDPKIKLDVSKKTQQTKHAGEGDLVSAMAARLAHVERTQKHYRLKLVSAEQELLQLRRYRDAHRITAESKTGVPMDMTDFLSKTLDDNAELRERVGQLEAALTELGIMTSNLPGQQLVQQPSNAQILFGHLQSLNDGMVEQHAHAVAGSMHGNVAKLHAVERIPLIVFKDGLFIRHGPLRPFTHPAAQAFVSDVMDGYFPGEFREQYPNGVAFALTDCTQTLHHDHLAQQQQQEFTPYAGSGRTASSGPRIRSLADIGNPFLPTSLPELLTSLPETVVAANGQVVHVRAGILDHMQEKEQKTRTPSSGNSETTSCSQQPATTSISSQEVPEAPLISNCIPSVRYPQLNSIPPGDKKVENRKQNMVKLRVKSDSGSAVMIIELPEDANIGEVKRIITAHRTLDTEFQLRATFPFPRAFDDDKISLLDADLAPSATLMIQSM